MSIYKFYQTPPPISVSTSAEEAKKNEDEIQAMRDKPDILVLKGEKLKNVTDIDIMKYIEDCPSAIEKYKNGDYGFKPSSSEEKKGIAKFTSKVVDANRIGEKIVHLANDYNVCH